MRFRTASGRTYEGRVVHNYGRGIVLAQGDGSMVEFDGGDSVEVTALDPESGSAWRSEISRSQAEFRQLLGKM